MESRSLKRVGAVLVLLLAVAGAGFGAWRLAERRAPIAPSVRIERLAPAGVRVKVEIVNTTRTRGLARRATLALRDAGFDVVRFTTDTSRRDSTLVLDRSGHADWARLVALALGSGRVESRPDSSRYLDVTVLLGANWRPPAQPFYP